MTYDWKAGDRAMVQIARIDDDGHAASVSTSERNHYWLPLEALHPLPAPDPLQALDKAVAEAADVWRDTHGNGSFAAELVKAIDARRALLKPRDLVQELIDAWRDTWRDVEPSGVHTNKRIWKAIIALEAERKRKD